MSAVECSRPRGFDYCHGPRVVYRGAGIGLEHLHACHAKLSRQLYEKFRDELTNELVEWFNQVDATYRGELRELNEVNFARFEATLDRGLTELGSGLRQEIAEVRVGMASLEGGLLARLGMAEGIAWRD